MYRIFADKKQKSDYDKKGLIRFPYFLTHVRIDNSGEEAVTLKNVISC